MASFPKIDQPCPLGIDERRRIDGYCGRCDKAVHALDAMSDAERIAFVRAAKGPLCVTYRTVARGAALGLGAALALSAPGVDAQQPVTMPAARPLAETPPPPSIYGYPSASAPAPQYPVDLSDQKLETITMTGGVSDPASVEFVDASDALPELPLVHDADPATSR